MQLVMIPARSLSQNDHRHQLARFREFAPGFGKPAFDMLSIRAEAANLCSTLRVQKHREAPVTVPEMTSQVADLGAGRDGMGTYIDSAEKTNQFHVLWIIIEKS